MVINSQGTALINKIFSPKLEEKKTHEFVFFAFRYNRHCEKKNVSKIDKT